jgi:hypothetical protein
LPGGASFWRKDKLSLAGAFSTVPQLWAVRQHIVRSRTSVPAKIETAHSAQTMGQLANDTWRLPTGQSLSDPALWSGPSEILSWGEGTRINLLDGDFPLIAPQGDPGSFWGAALMNEKPGVHCP